jgi:hypothetical protein
MGKKIDDGQRLAEIKALVELVRNSYFTKDYYNKSEIAELHRQFKNTGFTLQDLYRFAGEISSKVVRRDRKVDTLLSGKERLKLYRQRKLYFLIGKCFPFINSTKDGYEVDYGGNSVKFTSSKNVSFRTSKWTYYRTSYFLTLPEACLKVPIKYQILDGIINTKIHSVKIKNGITILDADVLTSKSRDFSIVRKIIAVKGVYSYHADNVRDAIEGLFNKIDKNIKAFFSKSLFLDSKISAKKYAEITGACSLGIQEWREKHNLLDVEEISVRELLPLLEKSNAYGYNLLKNNVFDLNKRVA